MMQEMFLTITIPILIAALGITAVVMAIKSFKDKEKNVFSMKMLWIAYLYIMCLVSLMLFLFGGMRFTKAMLANFTTPYFSYTTYEYTRPLEKPIQVDESTPENIEIVKDPDQKEFEYKGKTYNYNYAEYRSDIVDGITFFFSLAVIFAIHRYLVSKADTEKDSFLRKVYNFVALAQYGILSVIALPTAIYDLVKYFLLDLNLASYSRPVPGATLAMLLFVLPTWIIFLARMAKEYKSK